MSFHVGQKIECVNADWTHPLQHLVPYLARKGGIYHVRGFAGNLSGSAITQWLLLSEIRNPSIGGHEPTFAAHHFRPVTEKTTDISTFTEILDRENKKQRVPLSLTVT